MCNASEICQSKGKGKGRCVYNPPMQWSADSVLPVTKTDVTMAFQCLFPSHQLRRPLNCYCITIDSPHQVIQQLVSISFNWLILSHHIFYLHLLDNRLFTIEGLLNGFFMSWRIKRVPNVGSPWRVIASWITIAYHLPETNNAM